MDEQDLKAVDAVGEADGPTDDGDVQVWVVDDDSGNEAVLTEDLVEPSGASTDGGSSELEALRREIATTRESWMRAVADLDNFRKRSEREVREHRRYALFEPMRELLGVVDNLERALGAGGDVQDLKKGVELILMQLRDFLRAQGIKEVPAAGAPFDPAMHDAVSRFEDPAVSAPTVSDELQRGYLLHERLLRPALVRVAMPVSAGAAGSQDTSS